MSCPYQIEMPTPVLDLARGTRFKNFDNRSVVEAVRATMVTHHRKKEEGARTIGLDYRAYSFIIKLINLHDDPLQQQHKALIAEALAMIDKQKCLSGARQLTKGLEELLNRNRGRVRDVVSKTKKQNRRLDQTLIHISESCENTRDMEIPRDLSPQAAQEAIATLAASTVLIGQLMRRLLGKGEES